GDHGPRRARRRGHPQARRARARRQRLRGAAGARPAARRGRLMVAPVAPARYRWTRPALYPAQEAAIFAPARYAVIEASTKSGKPGGCSAWPAGGAWARGRPGRSFWWVAPIYAQARVAYRRLKRQMPLSAGQLASNESELTISLPNGAVLWFKGAE